jgi:error-prone DNA polymerase
MEIRIGLCSAYSLLFGVHKPGELLDKAASFGVKAASICDLNNLYGVHSFLEEAKERGIRPIIGTALTKNNEKKPVYCFVENRAGFGRLCEILTARNKDKELFDPLPLLRENSGGLGLASSDEAALSSLAGRVKRLYAAITPTGIGAVSLGRKLNIPPAFIDDSIFLEPEDFPVHRVLRAIALLKTTGNLAQADTAEKERVLKPAKELNRLLMSWPEAAKGSAEIAEICQFNTLFDGFIFPSYGENPGAELRKRVYDGACLRYRTLDETTIKRIEYE